MEIIIRQELPEEYWETEYMTKKAFWNLHFPGCNEHYLVHRLRSDKAYIPELSRGCRVRRQNCGNHNVFRSQDRGRGGEQ